LQSVDGEIEYCSAAEVTSVVKARRLVVVIHGDGRDARDYFAFARRAADRSGASSTQLIAPRFPTHRDVRREDGGADLVYWSSDGWKEGDGTRGGGDGTAVSSFAAIDQLVSAFVLSHPETKDVVLAGHSAGGQFVDRYAATSRTPEKLRRRGIRVRFVIANPSSYLYLSSARPVEPSLSRFETPDQRGRSDCRHYDDYKYGLSDPNDYVAAQGSAAEIRQRFLSREIVYLLGAADTDSDAPNLDRRCAADLQGANRLERGKVFYRYVGWVGGNGVYRRQALAIVPRVGHDAEAILNSRQGLAALFEAKAAR